VRLLRVALLRVASGVVPRAPDSAPREQGREASRRQGREALRGQGREAPRAHLRVAQRR
jgi:hypothetical protein